MKMQLCDWVLALSAILLLTTVPHIGAVRCKCTKESETVVCTDGVCETENGYAVYCGYGSSESCKTTCLMLDHPTMGVHYTCHTRGLKDGSCHNRTSKSGVSVKICGCNAPDFCNFSMWPDKSTHHHHKHHHKNHDNEETINSISSASILSSLAISFIFYFVL